MEPEKAKTIEEIKVALVNEELIQNRLRKHPEQAEELSKQLHDSYRDRMLKERGLWGCSVNRDLFSSLKAVLVEQEHLKALLADGHNNGKIESLLRIAKDKGDIYIDEIEASIDPNVTCPVLPPGETVSSISSYVREKTQSFMEKKIKEKEGKVVEKPKSDDRRKKIIRLLMQ